MIDITEKKRFKLDLFDSEVEMLELINNQAEIISDLEEENERLQHFESIYRQRTLELEKENEQLSEICENLINADANREYRLKQKIEALQKENEQLKTENERLQHFESIYRQRTLELEKKNEQLKDFIRDLRTKGTGKIDLASGYSFNPNVVLQDTEKVTVKRYNK